MSIESIKKLIEAEAKDLADEMLGNISCERPECKFPPWQPGESYHIETVTKYFTGVLVDITETDFVLANAAYIPSTGYFSDYCKGEAPAECEPFAEDQIVMVSRGAYVSAVKREIVINLIGRI